MRRHDYDERALPPADDVSPEEEYEEMNEEEKPQEEYYELPKSRSSRNMIWSIISVVLGVLSIPAAGIYVLSLILAVLSVGSGLLSRYRLGYFDKCSVFGLIFGIMGAVCGIFSMIVTLSGIFNQI